MPRTVPVVLGNWKDGLRNFSLESDARRFVEAIYEMPLELVVAFEADRDKLAWHFIQSGMVKGEDTAQAYATEILGRMAWMKMLDRSPQPSQATLDKPMQLVDARIEVQEPVIIDEEDLVHTCGDCGMELQIVRPGKYQCVNTKCGVFIR